MKKSKTNEIRYNMHNFVKYFELCLYYLNSKNFNCNADNFLGSEDKLEMPKAILWQMKKHCIIIAV